jgi:glycosyltransferase involved in cell wall biosynthesis
MHVEHSALPAAQSALKGLHLCFLAGTLGQGGAERQLFYILKTLKQCDADVTLLTLTRGEHWEARISDLGVPVEFVGSSASRLKRLVRICERVRELRPQVMQSQHFYTNSYASLSARLAGCGDIGAIRNNGFSEISSNGPVFGRLNLKLPRLLAANSRAAIRNLLGLGVPEQRLRYVPNVIDTEHFRSVSKRGVSKEFVILGVGRLEKQKRFDRFFEIISAAAARLPGPLRVRIAGAGSQRDALELLAQGARKKGVIVEFLGRVPDPRPLYRDADALLLTSDHEGTPNVVMEAMASGLPVVATNVDGTGDLLRHEATGFLFEPADGVGPVDLLIRLARDPLLRAEIAASARFFIERHRSLHMLRDVLARLYESTPARRPSTRISSRLDQSRAGLHVL